MRPWILVTGFGPFPGVPDNPTARLVRGLDGRSYGGAAVRAAVLDVSYDRAARQVRAAVAAGGWPRLVLHFGVAVGATGVRVEARAVNRKEAAVADVDGELGAAASIDPARPLDAALVTAVDVAGLVAALNASGISAGPSDDAGRYVCNATYFQSLAWFAAEGAAVPCVFVHVPDVAEGSCDPAGLPWSDDRLLSCGDVALRWLTGA
jgi:pyroglutamyl-peptidase